MASEQPNDAWERQWDMQGTLQFIRSRRCSVVALQFPDELLKDAVLVTRDLQARCGPDIQVYLLADTSYNSLGVDEVAAAHVNADAIVHYGRASFSALSRLPAYFVLGHEPLDIAVCAREIAEYAAAPLNPAGMKALLVFLDQPLLWALPHLQEALPRSGERLEVVYANVEGRELEPTAPETGKWRTVGQGDCCQATKSASPSDAPHQCDRASDLCNSATEGRDPAETGGPDIAPAGGNASHDETEGNEEVGPAGRERLGGYSWRLPKGVIGEECVWLWVGPEEAPALLQLQMTHHDREWAMLEPEEGRWQHGAPLEITRGLRRRYYLVEKAKNASIVGIVVGTLGVAGYAAAVDRIRGLAKGAGKKTYTILMGKPSPAKLANFPEVDVFVLVADPQGQVLDSKEFYAPLITPYEAQLAFSPGSEWTGEYRLDFDSLLSEGGIPSHEGVPPGEGSVREGSTEPRYSLLDGSYHGAGGGIEGGGSVAEAEGAIVARPSQSLLAVEEGKKHLIAVDSAASYLQLRRSYQGLEAPVVGAAKKEAEIAGEGRSGRAAQYSGEATGEEP